MPLANLGTNENNLQNNTNQKQNDNFSQKDRDIRWFAWQELSFILHTPEVAPY